MAPPQAAPGLCAPRHCPPAGTTAPRAWIPWEHSTGSDRVLWGLGACALRPGTRPVGLPASAGGGFVPSFGGSHSCPGRGQGRQRAGRDLELSCWWGCWGHQELSCQKGVLVQGMGSFPSPSSPLHAQRARRPVGCTAASPAPVSAQDHAQQRTPPSLSGWPGRGASVAAPCLSGVFPLLWACFPPNLPHCEVPVSLGSRPPSPAGSKPKSSPHCRGAGMALAACWPSLPQAPDKNGRRVPTGREGRL